MKKIILVIFLGVASLLFLGASCYKSSNTPATSSAPVTTNQVTISNFAFSPQTITVSPGTTVTWTNNDSTTHTVTSDNNSFNSNQLAPGNNFQFTFANTGTFSYHCSIHTNMTGQVIVQ